MVYVPSPQRYERPSLYRRCGKSGLKLPAISLGLWHNFGDSDVFENARAMLRRAFDLGVTHFDLANNYGRPAGSAERTLGRILNLDFGAHRDELIISTKAGYDMWPGPYGDFGSRKYMLASLDQSLSRLGLPYVDIFYSHRPDPETPLEETCGALAQAVRSGRALYAGISNYGPEATARAAELLCEMGTPCLIHQPRYSMFDRRPEQGVFEVLEREGIGAIVFSPLEQGLLSERYLHGMPEDARAVRDGRFLRPEHITEQKLDKVRKLKALAAERGQSVAQLALAWTLRNPVVTSALVGASSARQIEENVGVIEKLELGNEELQRIESILAG